MTSSNKELYKLFNKLETVIHGTKICEGNVLEKILFERIKASGKHDEVVNGKSIPLLKNEPSKKGDRKNHKVDIFCKTNDPPTIIAYNSKGKSFNNTESNESILAEYNKYKTSIQIAYPGYEVEYSILKDEYNNDDKKMVKYHYLAANGIPVRNTQKHMKDEYGELSDEIESVRQYKVSEILKERFKESGLSIDDLKEMFL
jgi:hypothetical protein